MTPKALEQLQKEVEEVLEYIRCHIINTYNIDHGYARDYLTKTFKKFIAGRQSGEDMKKSKPEYWLDVWDKMFYLQPGEKPKKGRSGMGNHIQDFCERVAKEFASQPTVETGRIAAANEDNIQMNDSQISFIHELGGKWFYNYSDSEGGNRHSPLFDRKKEAAEDRHTFFLKYFPEYLKQGQEAITQKAFDKINWKIQEWVNLIKAGYSQQALKEMTEYLNQ